MDQILADVSKTADELEESLSENLFDTAVKDVRSVLVNFLEILKSLWFFSAIYVLVFEIDAINFMCRELMWRQS